MKNTVIIVLLLFIVTSCGVYEKDTAHTDIKNSVETDTENTTIEAYTKNNVEADTESTSIEADTKNNEIVLDLPEELYGKYKVTKEVWVRAVGRIGSPSPLGDTFELQKNYVIYNGEKYPEPHIVLREENLDSADLYSEHRLVTNDIELDNDDTINMYCISADNNDLWDLVLLYKSNGDLFVGGHGDWGGKAEKIDGD